MWCCGLCFLVSGFRWLVVTGVGVGVWGLGAGLGSVGDVWLEFWFWEVCLGGRFGVVWRMGEELGFLTCLVPPPPLQLSHRGWDPASVFG